MNNKVAKDVAEQEFDRFVDCMELDANPSDMDEEDRTGFNIQKKRVISAIQSGALTIGENGEPTYTPQRTKDAGPITFYEPTGASIMAMDRRKKNEDVGKMYAIMADITRTHASTFSKMRFPDLKVCQSIITLFLG